MKRSRNFGGALLATAFTGLSACAHKGPEAHQVDVIPAQNVKVQIGDTPPRDVNAGEQVAIDQPAIISAPGFETMTVIPAEAGRASLNLKLVPLPENKPKEDQANAVDPQKEADRLLSDVARIQTLIAKGKGSEAFTLVEETQKNCA